MDGVEIPREAGGDNLSLGLKALFVCRLNDMASVMAVTRDVLEWMKDIKKWWDEYLVFARTISVKQTLAAYPLMDGLVGSICLRTLESGHMSIFSIAVCC